MLRNISALFFASLSLAYGQPVGPLPLAADPGYPRPRRFPSFDVSFGLRSAGVDYSGLSQVYTNVPKADPLLAMGFEVSLSEAFGIQAEAAQTISQNKIMEGWIGAAYYLVPFRDRNIRPYISAGVTFCSVEIRSGGPYTDAGTRGIGVFVGLEHLLGLVAAFDVYGGYRFLPELSGSFQNQYQYSMTSIPASVRLGGAAFGARLKFLQ